MSLEQRAERAREMANRPSLADRIENLIGKINPGAAADEGGWKLSSPPPWASAGEQGAAPYAIKELDDGRIQLLVADAEGSVIGGVGASVADALARVEEKVKR